MSIYPGEFKKSLFAGNSIKIVNGEDYPYMKYNASTNMESVESAHITALYVSKQDKKKIEKIEFKIRGKVSTVSLNVFKSKVQAALGVSKFVSEAKEFGNMDKLAKQYNKDLFVGGEVKLVVGENYPQPRYKRHMGEEHEFEISVKIKSINARTVKFSHGIWGGESEIDTFIADVKKAIPLIANRKYTDLRTKK